MAGLNASRTFFGMLTPGIRSETTVGFQSRYDDIEVGLHNTRERIHLSTVREDAVQEGSVGIFAENTLRWTNWFRTTAGLRADLIAADVSGDRIENSGSETDALVSPKFGIVLGPWSDTELYLNAGTGFHSNDARGTVTTLDPVSLTAVDPSRFLCDRRS